MCRQTEQLQLKLIQEKELNDQLEVEKTAMERQVLCVLLCVSVRNKMNEPKIK